MSSTYAGSPSYPATITLPSDGDVGNAASVAVPLSGVADRATYLKAQTDAFHTALDQARYLNWPTSLALTIGGAVAAYDKGNGLLYVTGLNGTTPVCYVVPDFGSVPSQTKESLSASAVVNDVPSDICTNNNGAAVITTSSRYVYLLNGSINSNAITSSRPDAVGSAITVANSSAAWDAVRTKFVFMCNNSTTGTVVRNSPTGSTWSAGGAPSGWTGYFAYRLASRPDTGQVMAVTLNAAPGGTATSFNVALSADGGTTWTTPATAVALGFSVVSANTWVLGLVWDPFNQVWVLNVYSGSGTAQKVLTSPDGTTWTAQYAGSGVNMALGNIATGDDGVNIAVNFFTSSSQPRIVYSLDKLNWRSTGIGQGAAAGTIGSQALFLGNSYVALFRTTSATQLYFSMRTGAY